MEFENNKIQATVSAEHEDDFMLVDKFEVKQKKQSSVKRRMESATAVSSENSPNKASKNLKPFSSLKLSKVEQLLGFSINSPIFHPISINEMLIELTQSYCQTKTFEAGSLLCPTNTKRKVFDLIKNIFQAQKVLSIESKKASVEDIVNMTLCALVSDFKDETGFERIFLERELTSDKFTGFLELIFCIQDQDVDLPTLFIEVKRTFSSNMDEGLVQLVGKLTELSKIKNYRRRHAFITNGLTWIWLEILEDDEKPKLKVSNFMPLLAPDHPFDTWSLCFTQPLDVIYNLLHIFRIELLNIGENLLKNDETKARPIKEESILRSRLGKEKNQNINQALELKNLLKIDSNDTNLSSDDFKKEDILSDDKEIKEHEPKQESSFFNIVQIFITFLISGFCMVCAGLVLNLVQHWKVFQNINEIFILIPVLLALKKNLEMTTVSRVSTQANLGNLNTSEKKTEMFHDNVSIIICQSTVGGFLASLFVIAVNWFSDVDFNFKHTLVLYFISFSTAFFCNMVLSTVMAVVIITCYEHKINPNNVAIPITVSLGDLITILFLVKQSYCCYFIKDYSIAIWGLPISFFLFLLMPFVFANHSEYTKQVLYKTNEWAPVVTVMAISIFSCFILDFAVDRFKGIAVFQPFINGVNVNLVAVQASIMSIFLHQKYPLDKFWLKDKLNV